MPAADGEGEAEAEDAVPPGSSRPARVCLARKGEGSVRGAICWLPAPPRSKLTYTLANDQVVKETIELMNSLRATMRENWDTLPVEKIQPRWCCGEYPYLFRGTSLALLQARVQSADVDAL